MRLIDADALLELIVKSGIYADAREINNAIINAPTVQRDGLVNVPIDPTDEMIKAGFFKCLAYDESDTEIEMKAVYKAMLQAAPTDKE